MNVSGQGKEKKIKSLEKGVNYTWDRVMKG